MLLVLRFSETNHARENQPNEDFLSHKKDNYMKLKLLLTTLLGAITLNGAIAGEYCAPKSAKCPVDCCPDSNGNISVGYHSDYILHGVRHMRDNILADVNYTFECLPLPVTIGASHRTSLSSLNNNFLNGDESDVYVSVGLPGIFGFDTSAGYIHRFHPNERSVGAQQGDSRGEAWIKIERELFCGLNFSYVRSYDRSSPSALLPLTANNQDEGSWIHDIGLNKSFCISDCIGLDLSGGVLYTDNRWPADTTAAFVRSGGNSGDNNLDRRRSSGWNSYYIKAALPISISCNATLIPYIGYNGSPDSWIADGVDLLSDGNNSNDIFHGGVTLSVDF